MKKDIPPGRAAPPEIGVAVIELAKLCAKHGFPLDQLTAAKPVIDQLTAERQSLIDSLAKGVVLAAKQKIIMAKQREIIRDLEQRLGIDDEL